LLILLFYTKGRTGNPGIYCPDSQPCPADVILNGIWIPPDVLHKMTAK